MKKLLIVLLALVLIVGGVFLWKGGHHAVFLANAMEDWLDDDASDQTLSLEVNGVSLSGDAFWTELGDDTVYGLETGGYGVYLRENVLYMDSGAAYSLPTVLPDWELVRKFLVGAVLYGRIFKEDGVYHFAMETEELTLRADLTAVRELETLTMEGSFSWSGKPVELRCAIAQTPEVVHTLPQTVTDAMVRAQMAPPMLITEPIEALLPALENLLPLSADVKLGVECGILSISETVGLEIMDGKAVLTRDGQPVSLSLPIDPGTLEPATAGLMLLRNGEFTREGDTARFRVTLPAESTAQLVTQLVPQVEDLGITFEDCEAVLTIAEGKLTAVTMTAGGSVPFLITTIPLSFSAEFDIH